MFKGLQWARELRAEGRSRTAIRRHMHAIEETLQTEHGLVCFKACNNNTEMMGQE